MFDTARENSRLMMEEMFKLQGLWADSQLAQLRLADKQLHETFEAGCVAYEQTRETSRGLGRLYLDTMTALTNQAAKA